MKSATVVYHVWLTILSVEELYLLNLAKACITFDITLLVTATVIDDPTPIKFNSKSLIHLVSDKTPDI